MKKKYKVKNTHNNSAALTYYMDITVIIIQKSVTYFLFAEYHTVEF